MFIRQTGSHAIFKHDNYPFNIAVPMHGKKDIPVGTINSILKKAGLK